MTLTNDVYIEKGSEMSQKPISQDVAVSSLIPWKSRERNGAQAIVEQLKVAGLIGDSQNLVIGNPGSGEEWLYLELDDQVQMGLAEAAVGSIVDGASRLYSKPTVAIAHGFVGFSGLQGSVFNAAQRQSPMLVIVGTADSHAHTGETHMYADVEGAAKAARAKYVKNEMLETNQPFLIDLILTEELLTEKQVSDFIQDWFNKLDHHASLEEVLPLVSDECLVMQLPEGTLYGKDEFKNWYEGVINTFFDEIHKVEETKINIEPKEITVNLTLEWRASRWKPPESNSEKLAFKAVQTWTLKGSPITKNAVITKYIVHKLTPLEGFPPL
ncbi:MAG: thiamine pyrophosphate-binding protein [Gloeotrichia echinulata GP01]